MIDLQKFCGEDDLREQLTRPFRYKGHVYATDGWLLVRVADDEAYPSSDKIAVEKALKLDEPRSFIKAPAVDLPPEEPAETVECEDCDGRGTEHDCPDCQCDCDTCGGKGEIKKDPQISTMLAGQIFNLKYVRALYSLPELEISPNPSGSGLLTPLYFRFADGVGALMPRRDKCKTHIELEKAEAA